MQVTGVVAQGFCQGVQKSNDIVPHPLLQPSDVVGIDTSLAEPVERRPRDLADLGPPLSDDELDPQPQLVALLWGEDLAHLRMGVSRDQSAAGLLVGGVPSVERSE